MTKTYEPTYNDYYRPFSGQQHQAQFALNPALARALHQVNSVLYLPWDINKYQLFSRIVIINGDGGVHTRAAKASLADQGVV